MKKVITFTMSFFLFLGMTFAQEIKPKFEKQDNLTKATYYYDNGTVKETGYLKNDKLHDKWISFNKEGKITTIANYKNGIKEGKWYVVENDTVKELTYKSNKLIKVENLKGSYIPLN
jgi:antitoxin component YwqK of YwqJK toxin-antitoxin module